MPNISDYMDWRGDIPLDVSPFNEVDNLIMSKLGILDFSGIVPEDGELPLREAAERYFDLYGDEDRRLGVLVAGGVVPLMKKLADSVRFGGSVLADYVNHIDIGREEQFSALSIQTPDGTRYVSFRGTDDTLVAWKEDFNMGVESAVPAQRDALAYLTRCAWRWPGPLRVGGHSKGGNLAVYAAMNSLPQVQERISAVYNNDGPGFRESIRSTSGYKRIIPKLHTFMPQYSLVGVLLTRDYDCDIVRSFDTGPAAHNGFTWEVLGTRFVRCEEFALRSRVYERAVRAWADDMDDDTRREFVNAFFDALSSTGAVTLTDLTEHKLRQALGVLKSVRQDADSREILSQSLDLLVREYLHSAREALPPPPKNPFSGMLKTKGRGKKRT